MKEHGALSSMLANTPASKKLWIKAAKKTSNEFSSSSEESAIGTRKEENTRVEEDKKQAQGAENNDHRTSSWTPTTTFSSQSSVTNENYEIHEDEDCNSSCSSQLTILNVGSILTSVFDMSHPKISRSAFAMPEGSFIIKNSQMADSPHPTKNSPHPLRISRFYSSAVLGTADGEVRVQIQNSFIRHHSSLSTSSQQSDDGPFMRHVISRGLFKISTPAFAPSPAELPSLPTSSRSSVSKKRPSLFREHINEEEDFANSCKRRLFPNKSIAPVIPPSPSSSNPDGLSASERALLESPEPSNDHDTRSAEKQRIARYESVMVMHGRGDEDEESVDNSNYFNERVRRVSFTERLNRKEKARLWLEQK